MIKESLRSAHRFIENRRLYYTLRKTELSLRSGTDQPERTRQLDRLRTYAERGQFPVNDEQAGYTPCFIGAEGTRCAVGYLMDRDGQTGVVQNIARTNNTVDLSIATPSAVVEWGQRHGLSAGELAQIQPSYDHMEPEPQPGLFESTIDYVEPIMGIAKGLAFFLLAYMAFRYTWWAQSNRSTITRIGLGIMVIAGILAAHSAVAFLTGEPLTMLIQGLTDTAYYDSYQVIRTVNSTIQAVLYFGVIAWFYPRYSDSLFGDGNDTDPEQQPDD